MTTDEPTEAQQYGFEQVASGHLTREERFAGHLLFEVVGFGAGRR
jgi:hypothetical protein